MKNVIILSKWDILNENSSKIVQILCNFKEIKSSTKLMNLTVYHINPFINSSLEKLKLSDLLKRQGLFQHQFRINFEYSSKSNNEIHIEINNSSKRVDSWYQPFRGQFVITGFSESQYNLVNEQLKFMANSDKCSKVFTDAGLKSVNLMINDKGLIILHQTLLKSSEFNNRWDGTEELRITFDQAWSAKENAYAADVTIIGQYRNGLHYCCLNGNSFNNTVDTIQRVIIHSMIHAGGKKGEMPKIRTIKANINFGKYGPPSLGGILRDSKHDLDFFNYGKNTVGEYSEEYYIGTYDKIMQVCSSK